MMRVGPIERTGLRRGEHAIDPRRRDR